MCIRDRAYDIVYPAAGASNNAIRIKVSEFADITNGQWADPVSYTHLDVYKRQILSIAPFLSGVLNILRVSHILLIIHRIHVGD